MAVPWGAIINGVVSIVGSVFDSSAKRKAGKEQADRANAEANAQIDAWSAQAQKGIDFTADFYRDSEYERLKAKYQKSRFGGEALTPEEYQLYLDYRAGKFGTKSGSPVVAPSNSISNPVTNPINAVNMGAGLKDGDVVITGDKIKTGIQAKKFGIPVWAWLGIVGAGGYMIYNNGKTPKRKRR